MKQQTLAMAADQGAGFEQYWSCLRVRLRRAIAYCCAFSDR